MRLLFIGNTDNPLLVDLAIEIKRIRPGCEIDAISERPSRHPRAGEAFSRILHPRMESRWRAVRGVKFFWFLWRYRALLRSVPDGYDIVHVFYLSAIWAALSGALARKGQRLVVTLFGSDVYRTPVFLKPLQQRLLRRARTVTATNSDTMERARAVFKLWVGEQRIIRFGLRPLDHIAAIRNVPQAEQKRALGFPVDRIVITAGTNASPWQHHEAIIAAVTALPEAQRQSVFVVIPMTMGGSDEHTTTVRAACETNGLAYCMITVLMTDEELARLRAATDILVQVQPTDQLSGAMQEHLCAGSVVITGSWLPYGVLRDAGVVFWTVDDRAMLPTALTECIAELDARRSICTVNADPITRLSSWRTNVLAWSALYD